MTPVSNFTYLGYVYFQVNYVNIFGINKFDHKSNKVKKPIYCMTQRLKQVEIGNHIFAIYNDKNEKFEDAFNFLKEGIFQNEVAMIITDELTKKEIIDRFEKECEIQNTMELIDRGDLIIKSTSEWYFPDGVSSIQRTKSLWAELLDRLTKRGKLGLRVFGEMSAFFKHGLEDQLLKYEISLEKKFDFPLTAICAYNKIDVERFFTTEQLKNLEESHHPILK